MNEKYKITFSYKKDIGRVRVSNEDECKIMRNRHGLTLMIVADGMGGYKKGDYASNVTVSYIRDEFMKTGYFLSMDLFILWLRRVIDKVNRAIYIKGHTDPMYNNMGCTLCIIGFYKNKYFLLNMGDSRAYTYKNETLTQISEDETYANYLYKNGKITKEEMETHPERHVLVNAIGILRNFHCEIKKFKYDGETILVCSDGLYNNVNEANISTILKSHQITDQKVTNLIDLANYNGGSDNIAICLMENNNDQN